MAKIVIKGRARLTWAQELVEDKDGGNFYMKVYPKLSDFREYRDGARMRQVAKEVLQEIKAAKLTGKTRIKK